MRKKSFIFGLVMTWILSGFSYSFAQVPTGYGALNESTTNPSCPRGYNKPGDRDSSPKKYGDFKEYQSVCDQKSGSYADCLRQVYGIGK
jgi:hypothetical protein